MQYKEKTLKLGYLELNKKNETEMWSHKKNKWFKLKKELKNLEKHKEAKYNIFLYKNILKF